MIVGLDSPLRRLPQDLDRRQTLFYDGARFTIEMVDVAYQRLTGALFQIAMKGDDDSFIKSHPMAEAFMDAWSIVDSTNRLRKLLKQSPGIKHRDFPERTIFLKGTKTVEELRDIIQHLDNEIAVLVDKNEPVWGTMSWCTRLDAEILTVRVMLMVAGSLFGEKEYHPVDPRGKTIDYPIGLITLSSGGVSISLSDVFKAVGRIAQGLERQIEKRSQGLPRAGSDLYVGLDFVFNDESPSSSKEH